MTAMLERRAIAANAQKRPQSGASLVEERIALEKATKKTAGLASRAFEKRLAQELKKLGK